MGKLITLYKYLLKRWKEPSTHAAIASICMGLSVQLPDSSINAWFTTLGVVFGGLGIFVKEGIPETSI